jgi:predicted ester cyclase
MSMKTMLIAGVLSADSAIMPAASFAGGRTPEEINAARYGELVGAAFNGGKLELADDYFEPGVVDHAPWPGHPADLAGFKAGLAAMRASFPDFHVTIERTIAKGDLLVAQLQISGSQLGPFMGAAPSGKTFKVEAIDIVRMQDGRIAEHWGLIDTGSMAAQLGL